MSTIQTPHEVASDVYFRTADFPLEPRGADLRNLMIQAIVADRVQRGNKVYFVKDRFDNIIATYFSADDAEKAFEDREDVGIFEMAVTA